jgi:glucose/arabinose dehydrogenase
MPALFRFAAALLSVLIGSAPSFAQTVPFDLEVVADGLSQPLYATAPAGDPRLFVVEQAGTIRIVKNGNVAAEPFLDVSDLIQSGGERGLLGLAFHPDYAANGTFYVNYTDREGDTQVVEYAVSDDPSVADPDPSRTLLSVEQPYRNHNGGWIAFGPDGLLYIGMGDGGSGGDPQGNGQDPNALLGKILRMDVDAGGDAEVFAIGVRNPWRNAFDGDDFYVADVGQRAWEEISVITLDDEGANLGWNIMEGFECFEPEQGCDQSGLVLPVHAYAHSEGCSITGGYVYRGSAIPEIAGLYFFADYCSGILSSFRFDGEGASEGLSYADVFGNLGPITSFGLDSANELYLTTQDGRLMKFVPR